MFAWFGIAVLVSALAMKLASFWRAGTGEVSYSFLFLSPVLSTESWDKRKSWDAAALKRLLLQFGVLLILFVASRWYYLSIISRWKPGPLARSYLSLVPLYLMGQFLSTAFELAYLPTGWDFPAHFRFPPLSRSLAEFWGKRWATWFTDWCHQMIFRPCGRRPWAGVFFTFLFSGVWHELLINVPLYLLCGVNLIGSMVSYFFVQAAGIAAERRFFRSPGFSRCAFAWAVIVIPSPLIINEGVLRIWGLWVS